MIEAATPRPLREATVPLSKSFGRVLSRDVASDIDIPPFDRSLMDGFAVRAADVSNPPATLEVIGEIPAGAPPGRAIGPGEAVAIMTGAPTPVGADAVVMVEDTSGFGHPRVTVHRPAPPGHHIGQRGTIARASDRLLTAGTRVDAEKTALLAMAGEDPLWVFERPSAAVLSTGDELVDPGAMPGPGQIRDCNGIALSAFLREHALEPLNLGRVGDDRDAVRTAIDQGLAHDVLLISGGVSVGTHDVVEEVLCERGVDIRFRRVAVKPGKPLVFGTLGDKLVFGMPGNPVSALVAARVFVSVALGIRMGLAEPGCVVIPARLTGEIQKTPDRLWFVPAVLGFDDGITARPLPNAGSADIPTAAAADGLIIAPRGAATLGLGEHVEVLVWNTGS